MGSEDLFQGSELVRQRFFGSWRRGEDLLQRPTPSTKAGALFLELPLAPLVHDDHSGKDGEQGEATRP